MKKHQNTYEIISPARVYCISIICAIILATVSAQTAQALEPDGTLILEKALFTRESFTANEQVFVLHLDMDGRIIVTTPENPLSITKADCADYNITRICYNESNFDTTRKEMKATVRAYSMKPKLQIFRATSPSSLSAVYIGQPVTVSTWINNTGYKVAEEVKFSDEYGPEINVTSSSCKKEAGSDGSTRIVTGGSLNAGEGLNCEYTIVPIAEATLKQRAAGRYYDGTKLLDVFSEQMQLISVPTISYTKATEKTSIYAGETVNLTINVTNRNTALKGMAINFTIILPASLESSGSESGTVIQEYAHTKTGNQVYEGLSALWSMVLYENQTGQLIYPVTGRKLGSSELIIKTKYSDEHGEYSLKDEKVRYEIKGNPVRLTTNLDSGTRYEGGYSYPLTVSLNNPSQHLSCRNGRVGIETELAKLDNFTLEYINASSTRFIVNTRFTAPVPAKETSFPFKASINCSTDYGDNYFAEVSKNIRVGRIDQLAITHSATLNSLESTRETIITVNVRNPRASAVDAEINDSLPDELRQGLSLSELPSIRTAINKESTVSAYSYSIKAPRVSKQKIFIINTTAMYKDNITGEIVSSYKEFSITVLPEQHKISYSRRVMDDYSYANKFMRIRHEITNTDTEPIKSLVITIPTMQGIVHKGQLSHKISSLNPGETATLDGEFIKVSKDPGWQGQLILEPVTLEYDDSDSFRFNRTFAPVTLGIQKGDVSEAGPALKLSKTAKVGKNSQNENIISFSVSIENLGPGTARNIVLADENDESAGSSSGSSSRARKWSFESLGQGEKTGVEFIIPAPSIKGNYLFKRTLASYTDGSENYFTASNDVEVEVQETAEIAGQKSPAEASEASAEGLASAIEESTESISKAKEAARSEAPSDAPEELRNSQDEAASKAASEAGAEDTITIISENGAESPAPKKQNGVIKWVSDFFSGMMDSLRNAFGGSAGDVE